MSMKISNQNPKSQSVLITGANRGLGFGFLTHYLKQGNTVIATCRNSDITVFDSLIKDYPNQLLIENLELTSEQSILNFAQKIKENKVTFDLVINNAGISIEENFGNWTAATFETNFKVNTIGPALLIQAISPFLKQGSKLVQMSSGLGAIALNINPEGPYDAYAVSKASLNILTKRIATKFYTQQIIVVAINPGWVQTDMGGAEATSTIDEAIKNMTSTINVLSLKNTGTFISDTGELLPW
ncbi:SDR family NAD(P)-dependent oxidoreductase [Aquimarina agarilytica]|uniref:SDR family NAD(P)-dependent oxidoreductase n=1 Tax=Aquimarina agarilytica TaxID=1087449 RepID=UPI0003002FC8|nr:SDR family NAD(P)-dependent oxidoreductase [Aquimarina agarilytica]